MESKRWVVSAFDFGNTDTHDCAFVNAATEQEAAELGVEILQRTWDVTAGLEGTTIEHVFVGPWPRTAYVVERRFDAERAVWQCCGGPNAEGSHHGGCPEKVTDG